MTATQAPHPAREHPRPSSDPSRTGAVWVTGTGAFLLLAAAALFVAVRWAEIPPSAKLAAIGALTGAFLLAGRRLRPTLPATSSALFHLGAFLIPVDVAALAVRAEVGWAPTLLAEGLVCGLTFSLASRSEGSVVLRWAAAASAVVAAAGLGAAGPVPAPIVLALAAAGALFSFRVQERADHALSCTQNGSGVVAAHERLSVAWAGVAGLAPLTGVALDATRVAPGVVERLGLAGDQPGLAAAVTGTVTAGVLGVVARRRLDPALALLAAVCALVGIGLTGARLDPSPWGWAIGACAVLVAVEIVALLLRRDPFWSSPAGEAAVVAEVLAVPGSLCAAGVVLFSPFLVVRSTSGAVAVGLLAVTWIVADLRRRPGAGTPVSLAILLGGRFAPATMGVAACVPAAVAMATGSGPLTGVSLVATAAALAAGGRPLAAGAAVAATLVAPHAVLGRRMGDLLSAEPAPDASPAVLLTVAAAGFAGSLLLARMVSWRAALADAPEPARVPWLLAAAAPLPVLVAALRLGEQTGEPGALLVLAVGLTWLAAAAADDLTPARRGSVLPPATATRAVALAVVLGQCRDLDAVEVLVVAGLAAAFVAVDALRLDEPRLAFGLVAALPVAAIPAGTIAELSVPRSGVALSVAAVVVAGLGSLLSRRWRDPVLASAGALAGVGLVLAAGDATALADALLVTGGVAVTAGLGWSRLDVVVAGGGAVTLGTWARLVDAGVGASEPYVAPIAAVLLLAGLLGRDDEGSSWVTIGPAVALLGGAALVERLSGGSGWHALVTGIVGVVSVAAGGRWRLGAPLLLGTGLLVALVGHESLAVSAGVPTWGWLAVGGTTLLGIGIALERAERGPLETGRRLVDVVQQRYR